MLFILGLGLLGGETGFEVDSESLEELVLTDLVDVDLELLLQLI